MRVHTGTHFWPTDASASPQLAHLAQFLQWLSPLTGIGAGDQRVLGLLAPRAAEAPSLVAEALEPDEEDADFDPDATPVLAELEDPELEGEQELRLAQPE